MTENAQTQRGLDGFSWFGLVVYFTVEAFVIKGIRIPVPFFLSRPLIHIAAYLRLSEPVLDRPLLGDNQQQPDSIVPFEPESVVLDTFRTTSTGSSLSSLPTAGTNLNAKSVEVLPSDLRNKRLWFSLNLRTAPVLGVLILLVTTTIDGSVIKLGIKGGDGVRPYDVLVLFISLAYISTALDSTGGLKALAFYISQKSAQTSKLSPPSADHIASGPKLFSILYIFWFLSGVLVGNDPIILSGTAFLGYFTRVTGIVVPIAWIISQFISANIASAVLVSSNPTNVLIAGAFELNFITGYTAYTILPAFITALCAYVMLYVTFSRRSPPSRTGKGIHPTSKYIPAHLLPPDVDPRSVLLDPAGATFHSVLMVTTLALLVGTTFLPAVEVWMITGPAGITAVTRDFWSERRRRLSNAGANSLRQPRRDSTVISNENLHAASGLKASEGQLSLPRLKRRFKERFPSTASTISRLPISLLIFAACQFILSRALTSLGWTSIFAGWLAKVCINPASAVFFLGYFIAVILCPICGTNIGATILMVEILRDPGFSQSTRVLEDPRILKGAVYSTALASNLGAFSWAFSSSLAGLLWVSILRQKGIIVRGRDFAAWNCLFLPVLSTVASTVVWLEIVYFPA